MSFFQGKVSGRVLLSLGKTHVDELKIQLRTYKGDEVVLCQVLISQSPNTHTTTETLVWHNIRRETIWMYIRNT